MLNNLGRDNVQEKHVILASLFKPKCQDYYGYSTHRSEHKSEMENRTFLGGWYILEKIVKTCDCLQPSGCLLPPSSNGRLR